MLPGEFNVTHDKPGFGWPFIASYCLVGLIHMECTSNNTL